MNPVEARLRLLVRNPYDGRDVCEVPFDAPGDVAAKAARAREAFREWRAVPIGERVRRVSAAIDALAAAREEVAREVTLQMGKPIAESRREVDTMVARARHMAAIAEEALRPDEPPAPEGLDFRIVHEPLGVVLDVAAWNYPLLIAVNVVVPALLAGNTVLLKHSSRTPLCGARFAKAFEVVGPPGLVSDLVLSHDATLDLIRAGAADYVAFTGSVRGGREVYAAAAERLVDAGLELGGKDAAYVAEDADLDAAVAGIVDGACYNAGQSCCAVERVYVHESLHRGFVERAARLMGDYRLGDPMDESTTMGPLANPSAAEALEAHVDDARARGARVACGGRRLPERPRFFPPTLIDGCPQDAPIMQEESFGPTLPVLAVADDDDALRKMNESRYGLTASVWTTSAERADWFAGRLDVGTVYRNRCDFLEPSLPWTGVKESGMGSTLSRFGFLHLTRRKSLNFRR